MRTTKTISTILALCIITALFNPIAASAEELHGSEVYRNDNADVALV